MKNKFIAAFIVMLISLVNSFAQTQSQASQAQTAKESSNAEQFSERSGSLIETQFIEIGTVRKCHIQVVYFTDLTSNTKQSAVRFENEYVGRYNSDTKVAILDADEIDGLIKSIRLLQNKITAAIPNDYTEIAFKSRSGFSAGCFSDKKNSSWSSFMKLEKFDSDSYIWMNSDDLPQLLSLLEQAQAKL